MQVEVERASGIVLCEPEFIADRDEEPRDAIGVVSRRDLRVRAIGAYELESR